MTTKSVFCFSYYHPQENIKVFLPPNSSWIGDFLFFILTSLFYFAKLQLRKLRCIMFTMQDKISLLVPEHLRESFLVTSDRFQINTVFRSLHFLAQTKHESNNFKSLEENLNYSSDGLLKTFPKYFPDKATALTYERKPIAIASRVYANRMGNGDEASRDGWTYRGRGALMTTGKFNYGAFGEAIGQDLISNPDLVKTNYPMESAGYFWFKNNLNVICDRGLTDDVIKTVTRVVNGGYNNLNDRIENLNEYCKQLMINR